MEILAKMHSLEEARKEIKRKFRLYDEDHSTKITIDEDLIQDRMLSEN